MAHEFDKTFQLNAALAGMTRLPLLRQLGLLLGLAASIALGMSVVMWQVSPNDSMHYLQNTVRDSSARHQHLLEEKLARNIETILSPIVGPSRVKALVVASMDFAQTESGEPGRRAQESAVARNRTSRADTGVNGKGKQTPQLPEVSVEKQDSSMVSAPMSQGRIKRLSVAVVVDHKKGRNNKGELVSTAYTKAELHRFTSLVKEAVGFDAERGDTVDVINAEFSTLHAVEPTEAASFTDTPWFRDTGRQVVVVLMVVLVLFGVIRPVMRNLATLPQSRGEGQGSVRPDQKQEQITVINKQARNNPDHNRYQSDLELAKSLVLREPKRVAKVVKLWVNEG